MGRQEGDMLKRVAKTVLMILVGLFMLPAGTAFADVCNPSLGKCDVRGTFPGEPPKEPGKPPPGGDDDGGGGVCTDEKGTEVSCTSDFGAWVQSLHAWCKPEEPQPSTAPPAEGYVSYFCVAPGSSVTEPFQMWLPPSLVSAPPPDPGRMAQELVARINFEAPDGVSGLEPLEKNPDSLGAVGLPVWLWIGQTSPKTTGPISDSASERGYTVSITGKVSEYMWDIGDGSPKISCGLGTPFNVDTMTVHTPVVCGRQEGYSKQGEYRVTVSAHWVIKWSGIGQSGTIEFDKTTTVGTVRVGELHSVIVNR